MLLFARFSLYTLVKIKESIDCYIYWPASFLWFPELSEDGGVDLESEDELSSSRSSLERQGHRGNTTVHVCWHRNTSVSMVDFSVAVEVRCISFTPPLPWSLLDILPSFCPWFSMDRKFSFGKDSKQMSGHLLRVFGLLVWNTACAVVPPAD